MIIDDSKMPNIWYENSNAEVFIPENRSAFEVTLDEVPDEFKYYNSQFPCCLVHSVYRVVLKSEVDKCTHSNIHPTGGWIGGIEGRECNDCNGTQTKRVSDVWPERWESHGVRSLVTTNKGYSQDLVVSMVNPYLKQWIKAFIRNKFKSPKKYTLDKAIVIAANSCERCMNVLRYKYGLNDGYIEESEDWYNSGTLCKFCEHMPLEKSTPETRMQDLLK